MMEYISQQEIDDVRMYGLTQIQEEP